VFTNATNFQKRKKGQKYVSVVVLDEVGLAEDSPSLPLKTLHPLLEDGTTGSTDVISSIACNLQMLPNLYCLVLFNFQSDKFKYHCSH